jgi:DNA transformation protein
VAEDSFKDFVLDQLRALPDVRCKAMFGGHGLYLADAFFGIVVGGRLFFKTDARTRGEYVALGMAPFHYKSAGRAMTLQYHEVPPAILESPSDLRAWARRAVECAARKGKARKGTRAKTNPRR